MPCQIIKTANVAAAAATNGPAIPTDVIEALFVALDDEHHAEATYAAIIARHGDVRPFSNIIKAERRHAAAIAKVLKAYNVAVPGNGYLSGHLALEDTPDQLGEACAQGVAAEIENVRLYDERLIPTVAAFPDIAALFTELRDSSRDRHLPAFRRCATRGEDAPDLTSRPHGGCGKGRRRAQPKGH